MASWLTCTLMTLYGSCRPADVASFYTIELSRCVDETCSWMKSNRLQSNPDKAEVLWCATSRRQYQLPTTALLIDGAAVDPVTSVRDPRIHIDVDLVMRTHVQLTVQYQDVSLHFASYVRSAIRYHHPCPSHWWSLVLSRLDYGNAVLVGIPAYLVRRLQSVLNAAARLIYHMRSTDHITDALVSLRWLRVPERIQYKIALLTYEVLQGSAPRYLGPLARVTYQPGRRTLHSASSSSLLVPPFKPSTVGSRVFSVAGPRVWNTLPEETTSAPSLTIFCQRLKTWLVRQSHPYLII